MDDCIKDRIRKIVEEHILIYEEDKDLARAESVQTAENICDALDINEDERHIEGAVVVAQMGDLS